MTIFERFCSIFKGTECDEEQELKEYLEKYAEENGFKDLYRDYQMICGEIKQLKDELSQRIKKGDQKSAKRLRDTIGLKRKKWQKLHKSLKVCVAKHKK